MGWKTIKKANALNELKKLSSVENVLVEQKTILNTKENETIVENQENIVGEESINIIETNTENINEILVSLTEETDSQLLISLPEIGNLPIMETVLETTDISEKVQEVKKISKKKKS